MSDRLLIVYLAWHGETAWTITGQHAGLTDSTGGTSQGTCLCKSVHQSLAARTPDLRVSRIRFVAEIDSDLVEWNYGEY
jgi:broad specificity phosphatase PhoE